VPQNKDLKRLVRARMAETGENYTQALTHLQGQTALEPLPPAWRMTGSRAAEYEATEVTGWAGLWLRIDGPNGVLVIDNMEDRALRGTTDWIQAAIVLDVADQARVILFGALLSGAGAVDLTRLRVEEAGEAVPTTIPTLPDEPQALDFGAAP
jgi:hypothetical protein